MSQTENSKDHDEPRKTRELAVKLVVLCRFTVYRIQWITQ